MTKEEGKRFFGSVRRLDNEIRALRLEVEALMNTFLPSAIRYDTDRVQTSPHDVMSDKYARIEGDLKRLEKEIVRKQLDRAQAIMNIKSTLEALEDDRERLVLTAYYIGHKSVQSTARKMHYSPSMIYEFMQRGIRHAERVETGNDYKE